MSAPTLSLYEVGMEALTIEELLIESEGELTPELEARWNNLLTAGKDKIEAAAKVVRSLEANAQVCMDESKRLRDRAQSITNNVERLKERIKVAVDLAFGGKVKTPLFTVWAQTSAPVKSFELHPDAKPEVFARNWPGFARTTIELNKQACMEALKSGTFLPLDVEVTEREGTRFLRIK